MKIFIIGLLLIILYNMFSRHKCFLPLCFLNQREGLTPSPPPCPGFASCADAENSAIKARAANQAANIKIQKANDTRNTPSSPPIVTSVAPSPYASTINTSTIAKNTADISTLFGEASSFSSLVAKVNGLGGTVSAHEAAAHANRPDYELLGCRATTALIKFEEQIAQENASSGSSGW
jgi:hypothetical protein